MGTLQKMFMRSFTKAVERLSQMKLHVPTCALESTSMIVGPLLQMVPRWPNKGKGKITADNFFIVVGTNNGEDFNSFNRATFIARKILTDSFSDYYKRFQDRFHNSYNSHTKCKYYHGYCKQAVITTNESRDVRVEPETKEEENNRYFWILICLTIIFYQPVPFNGFNESASEVSTTSAKNTIRTIPCALSDLTFRKKHQQEEIVKLKNHLLTVPQSNWDNLYSHLINDHVRCRENGLSDLSELNDLLKQKGTLNVGYAEDVVVKQILNSMFLRYPSPSLIMDFSDRLPWDFFVKFDIDVKEALNIVEAERARVNVGYSETYHSIGAKIIIAKAKTNTNYTSCTGFTGGSWRAEAKRLTTEKLISEFSLIRSLSYLSADYIWGIEEPEKGKADEPNVD